jgi:gluconolactonase
MLKNSLFFPLLFISTTVLAQNEHSTDWMPDNSFTQGIEGPAVDSNGNLFAVNYSKEGTIGKVTNKNKAEVYLTLPNGSVGNGIRFDHQGNMYIADYVNHNVLIVDTESKNIRVFSHNDKMNQPNDIAIMNNGILFASDPNWSDNSGKLWRINADGSNSLIEEKMGTTNGIEVSPDNKTLYVNESVQRIIWRYTLDEKGNIHNKTLFHKFEDHGMDGMRTDNKGNLYIARYGAGVIAVLSPQGKLIKTLKLTGKNPTNVAFGGKEGKQLFITMQKRGAIETFNNDIAGRNYP